MKKKGTAALALAFVALLGGAYMLYDRLSGQMDLSQLQGGAVSSVPQSMEEENTSHGGEEPSDTEPQYQMAPDFTMEDAEGNVYALSDFIGKPVVVNFWASWCGPCKNEMPEFENAYARYGDKIEFLMVNLTGGGMDTREKADAVIADGGYTFPVYYDTFASAAMAYGIRGVPMSLFVDAEGLLKGYANGMLIAETLQIGIDRIYTAEE